MDQNAGFTPGRKCHYAGTSLSRGVSTHRNKWGTGRISFIRQQKLRHLEGELGIIKRNKKEKGKIVNV